MKYTWTLYGAETWDHGQFDTIEECIEEAKEDYDPEPGTMLAIGEVVPFKMDIDATKILERLEETACEEWTPSGTIAKEHIDSLSAQLTKCLKSWLAEHNELPQFFSLENIQTVEIQEEK